MIYDVNSSSQNQKNFSLIYSAANSSIELLNAIMGMTVENNNFPEYINSNFSKIFIKNLTTSTYNQQNSASLITNEKSYFYFENTRIIFLDSIIQYSFFLIKRIKKYYLVLGIAKYIP